MSTLSTPVTVDLTDAFPASRVILVEDVRPGMSVFDTFGGTHPVATVKVERYGVVITRTDRVRSWHPRRTSVTVIGGEE